MSMCETLHEAVFSDNGMHLSIHLACHEQDLPFQQTVLCHPPRTLFIPKHLENL